MGHVTVVVAYTFTAPDGSSIVTSAAGEAMDSGDKATPKAMSVAYRTALLQALCLPTDESRTQTPKRTTAPTSLPSGREVADVATWQRVRGNADGEQCAADFPPGDRRSTERTPKTSTSSQTHQQGGREVTPQEYANRLILLPGSFAQRSTRRTRRSGPSGASTWPRRPQSTRAGRHPDRVRARDRPKGTWRVTDGEALRAWVHPLPRRDPHRGDGECRVGEGRPSTAGGVIDEATGEVITPRGHARPRRRP